MGTRVKVVCNFKETRPGWNQLAFSPVISGSEENKRFFAATPGGQFTFYTINDEAAAEFEMGKEYYFDIFPAEHPLAPVPIAQPVAAVQEPVAIATPVIEQPTQSNQNVAPQESSAPAVQASVEAKSEPQTYPEPLPGYEIAGGRPQS